MRPGSIPMKKGFTIIELLTVIGIIAVLMTIVTTASMSAIRSSRARRTDAMRTALQASIATYQAADPQGRWPGAINSMAESGQSGWIVDDAAQTVFQIIVQKSTGESGGIVPLIDPNALFVAPSGVTDGKATRPELHCGICGEHGGDPSSVEFCHRIGLDYVSCSPFRVPIARLAAAQAAIANK